MAEGKIIVGPLPNNPSLLYGRFEGDASAIERIALDIYCEGTHRETLYLIKKDGEEFKSGVFVPCETKMEIRPRPVFEIVMNGAKTEAPEPAILPEALTPADRALERGSLFLARRSSKILTPDQLKKLTLNLVDFPNCGIHSKPIDLGVIPEGIKRVVFFRSAPGCAPCKELMERMEKSGIPNDVLVIPFFEPVSVDFSKEPFELVYYDVCAEGYATVLEELKHIYRVFVSNHKSPGVYYAPRSIIDMAAGIGVPTIIVTDREMRLVDRIHSLSPFKGYKNPWKLILRKR